MDRKIELKQLLKEAESFYRSLGQISCPYFNGPIVFTSVGFHHLQFSAGRERNVNEQILKLRLLKTYISEILRRSGTVQEYRKLHGISYWGFTALVGNGKLERVKVIIRQKGNGKVHFWSVMPAERHKGDEIYLQQ